MDGYTIAIYKCYKAEKVKRLNCSCNNTISLTTIKFKKMKGSRNKILLHD